MRKSDDLPRRKLERSWLLCAAMLFWVGGGAIVSAWAQQDLETPQTPRTTLEDLLRAADEKPAPATRQPVPDAEAVQKAQKMLEELYQGDFAAAKTPDKRRALAGRLLAEALEAQIPAEQWALLQAARHWAVQAGDLSLALRVSDVLLERFPLDPWEVKIEVFEGLMRSGAGVPLLEVVDAAESLIEEALRQDAFDAATRLSRVALNAARRTKNAELLKRLSDQAKRVEQATKAYQKIQAAQDTLRQNPDDSAAHLVLGRYLCLVKAQWKQGLPHLAKGADESLRLLAEQDLSGPTEPAKQFALAEAWWNRAAQEQEAQAKAQIQGRAAHWYQAALPHLGGLDKIKAERRIQEAAQAKSVPSVSSGPAHYLDPANRKNILILLWSLGQWRNDAPQLVRIEKVESGGYRVLSHPNVPGWYTLAFPRVPIDKYRFRMTYTLEKGESRIHVRNVKLPSPPFVDLLSNGPHTVEAWVENNRLLVFLDRKPAEIQRDDPQHYVCFDVSIREGSSILIHELRFVPLQEGSAKGAKAP